MSLCKECKNPACRRPFVPNDRGRPREYCGKPCRDAAYRSAQGPRSPAAGKRGDDGIGWIADAVGRRADTLVRAVHEDDDTERTALGVLRQVQELRVDLDDLEAGAVRQARERGASLAQIASQLNLAPGTVSRRFAAVAVERRLRQRRRREDDGRATERAEGGEGTGTEDGPAVILPPGQRQEPAGPDPGPLACALSALHRGSRQTLRALAERAGVSASYVSRVLSGDRRPSWRVTRGLVEACGGDPADLLPLWEDSRGHPTAVAISPAAFHDTLRDLHLAAGQPHPDSVRDASGGVLSRADIAELLYGWELPDWGRVDRFVSALGGDPVNFRALWRAARGGRDRHGPAFPIGAVVGPPAAAFG
ncbi:helix-turn-helix transcriptional regulator [Streptomyces sp. B6B3]|uniref:helix-turn-helix domain-containing protein n=1 Tax=Streptomyces sp. B6B3 TaxID=3153570 RepID=UPI00325EA4DC